MTAEEKSDNVLVLLRGFEIGSHVEHREADRPDPLLVAALVHVLKDFAFADLHAVAAHARGRHRHLQREDIGHGAPPSLANAAITRAATSSTAASASTVICARR